MKAEAEREQVSYQWALRVAGRMLDEQGRWLHAVLETPGGVAVISRASDHGDELVMQSIPYQDLVTRREVLTAQREGRRPADLPGERPPPCAEPGKYADIMRAVGWELDDADAYNILVHQVQDRIFLSYEFIDPRDNYLPTKRRILLGAKELALVMRSAYERRAPDNTSPSIWSRLAGRQKWPARAG